MTFYDPINYTGPLDKINIYGEITMNTIKVKGMSCQHCVASTTKALQELDGISNVVVDLEKGEAHYEGDVELEAIKAAISKIGFEVE